MSCKELEQDHTTLARNNTPVKNPLNSDLDLKGDFHNGPEIESLFTSLEQKAIALEQRKPMFIGLIAS
jgi:hypothetical protein